MLLRVCHPVSAGACDAGSSGAALRPAGLLPHVSCGSWDDAGYPQVLCTPEGAEGGKFMAAFMRSMRLSAYAEKNHRCCIKKGKYHPSANELVLACSQRGS